MSMGGILIKEKAKKAVITAVITRADGTVEDLGEIAYWHKNPVKRWFWHAKHYTLKFLRLK